LVGLWADFSVMLDGEVANHVWSRPAKISAARQKAIDSLREYLSKCKRQLREGNCSTIDGLNRECNALQLGHFMSTQDLEILDGKPKWSLRYITDTFLDNVKILYLPDHRFIQKCSGWVPGFQKFVRETLDGVQGLNFEQFPSRK